MWRALRTSVPYSAMILLRHSAECSRMVRGQPKPFPTSCRMQSSAVPCDGSAVSSATLVRILSMDLAVRASSSSMALAMRCVSPSCTCSDTACSERAVTAAEASGAACAMARTFSRAVCVAKRFAMLVVVLLLLLLVLLLLLLLFCCCCRFLAAAAASILLALFILSKRLFLSAPQFRSPSPMLCYWTLTFGLVLWRSPGLAAPSNFFLRGIVGSLRCW